jgi:hypothetical protein
MTLTYFVVLMALSPAAPPPSPSPGQGPSTEVEVTLRNCTKLEASAILGANATGCVVYDVRKKQAITTVEVCGGLMLKLALKEVLVGAEVGHEKLACVTIRTTLNPSDAGTAIEALSSDSRRSELLRKQVLEQVKAALVRLGDKELEALGLTRQDVRSLEKVRFEHPTDETKRSRELRREIEKCPASSRDLSMAPLGSGAGPVALGGRTPC